MRWRCCSKYPLRNNILFLVYRGQNDFAQMPFTWPVYSEVFYEINNAHFDPKSLLIVKKLLSIKNDLAAIKATLGPDLSLLITLSWLLVNLLHQVCIAGFVKHLSLCTGHNSRWIIAYALAFAHGKRITEYCSLRDTLNGKIAALNVDKWRHSDVMVIKLTADTQHKIPYKTYIWIFSLWKLPKLCCFVTYLWNDPRNLAFSQCFTSIYLTFDGQTEFSQVFIFNFTILSYSRNSRKFDAREKYVFYST